MTKFFRRQFWLISAFLKRYYQIIFGSIIFSILIGLLLNTYIRRLPQKQSEIRIGLIGQFTPQTLPNLVKNILNSGLTKIGPNQTVIPNLAEKWETIDGGKSYTFSLKKGLLWSDGSSLKTSDLALNIPDVNITFPSENQISFVLPQTFSPFPSVLTIPITNKVGLTISAFKVSLTQNSNGLLTKIRLQSKDQIIDVRIFPSSNQALTSYKLGELDAIYNYPKADNSNLTEYGKIHENNNYHQAVALFFNNQDPLLKDKSLRQGIAYAIKDKTFGSERAIGPISRISWAFNPLVKLYDFDAVKAASLIKASLSDKTQTLNLELATIPQYLSIAEEIKKNLDPNLINLNIKVVTSKPESYQLFLTLFEIPADPDQYVFWHSSHGTNNISHANNERLDKDLEDGRRTDDLAARKQIYNDFQRTFDEELPTLFLFYPRYYNLARHEAIFDIIKPETAL